MVPLVIAALAAKCFQAASPCFIGDSKISCIARWEQTGTPQQEAGNSCFTGKLSSDDAFEKEIHSFTLLRGNLPFVLIPYGYILAQLGFHVGGWTFDFIIEIQ